MLPQISGIYRLATQICRGGVRYLSGDSNPGDQLTTHSGKPLHVACKECSICHSRKSTLYYTDTTYRKLVHSSWDPTWESTQKKSGSKKPKEMNRSALSKLTDYPYYIDPTGESYADIPTESLDPNHDADAFEIQRRAQLSSTPAGTVVDGSKDRDESKWTTVDISPCIRFGRSDSSEESVETVLPSTGSSEEEGGRVE